MGPMASSLAGTQLPGEKSLWGVQARSGRQGHWQTGLCVSILCSLSPTVGSGHRRLLKPMNLEEWSLCPSVTGSLAGCVCVVFLS